MNRLFIAMCMSFLAAQFNLLSAQTMIMKIWKGGDVTATYQTTDVDSVTFGTNSGGEIIPDGNPSIISFSVKSSTLMTRAAQTSSDEAAKINNEFIVWGEKNETDAATADANIVFRNYRVQYVGNDGNTESNTNGWEYVGMDSYASNVFPAAGTQPVKYWDSGKAYTFTAVSALSSDIASGKVKITKTYANASKATHGYNIELTNGADASAIYIANRNDNASVSPVEMKFNNFQSKIRFGFYETVPGYKVQITGIKYNNAQRASTTFGVDGDFIQVPTIYDVPLTYVVTYNSNNEPIVTINRSTPTALAYQIFGNKIFNTDLGTSSVNATFDLNSNDYTSIIPNPENETPMSFTVSYKLISEDTGEVIQVEGCQVTVPAIYCQWQPNYAYTYRFKVSDNSSGLYSMALDSVIVEETDTSTTGGTTR